MNALCIHGMHPLHDAPCVHCVELVELRAEVARLRTVLEEAEQRIYLRRKACGCEDMCPRCLDDSNVLSVIRAALHPDQFHPTGECTCGGEGRCHWCLTHCATCGVLMPNAPLYPEPSQCLGCATTPPPTSPGDGEEP